MESVVKEEVKEKVEEVKEKVEETKEEAINVSDLDINRLSEIQLSEDKKSMNVDLLKLISELVINNKSVEGLVSEAKITISSEELEKILNVIKYLNTNTIVSTSSASSTSSTSSSIVNLSQLEQIINAINKVLIDGKLELHEVPEIVTIVYANILNVNIKLSNKEVGLLLKFLIYILIKIQVIKITTEEFILVSKILDSSIALLQINIKIPTNKFCFWL